MKRLKQYGFYLLFFSLPLVALFKGKGIVLSLILFFFLSGGLQKAFNHLKNIKLNGRFLIILGLLGISTAIAGNGIYTLLNISRLILLCLCGYYTITALITSSSTDKQCVSKIFLRGTTLYVLFLLMECYTGFFSALYAGTPQFNTGLFIRGTVILTFLSIPFWTGLRATKYPKLYQTLFALSLGLILLKAQPSAARLAVIIAIFCGLTAYTNHGLKILFTGISVWISVAPFLFTQLITRTHLFSILHYLPSSYQHRIQIWEIFAKKALTKPLFGHGFHARMSPSDMTDKLCLHYKVQSKIPKIPQISHDVYDWGKAVCFDETVITTHPHNGALQIWFEGGVFGVIIALYFLWALYKIIIAQPKRTQSLCLAVFGLSLTYWNVSFGLWQNWLIAAVALTIGLIHTIKGPQKGKKTHV